MIITEYDGYILDDEPEYITVNGYILDDSMEYITINGYILDDDIFQNIDQQSTTLDFDILEIQSFCDKFSLTTSGTGLFSGIVVLDDEPLQADLTLRCIELDKIIATTSTNSLGGFTFQRLNPDLHYDIIARDINDIFERKIVSNQKPAPDGYTPEIFLLYTPIEPLVSGSNDSIIPKVFYGCAPFYWYLNDAPYYVSIDQDTGKVDINIPQNLTISTDLQFVIVANDSLNNECFINISYQINQT